MSSLAQIWVINKPAGMTSHDVVDRVRHLTGEKVVGHAGTLDPAATGVLVILVGREATKQSDQLRAEDKEYVLEMELGQSTDTLDGEGKITRQLPLTDPRLQKLDRKRIEEVLEEFRGEYRQEVPMYSAVKVRGVKLYEIARGQKEPPPDFKVPLKKVIVKKLELLDFSPVDVGAGRYPTAKLRALVSGGTYTRALVRDIGAKLGVPAYQKSLVRTRSGRFTLDNAVTLEELSREVKVSDEKK